MKKVMVVGYNGKTGSVVFEELAKAGFVVVGKGRNDDFLNPEEIEVVVDFGGAESSVFSAGWCMKNKIPLVIGSTGQTTEQMQVIQSASDCVPVIMAGNFSMGIWFIKKMLKTFKCLSVDDVCIFEKHHKNKKDSPSGTSLELEKKIIEALKVKPQVLSMRGGCEIGTHTVSFYFGDECIEICHKAFSRVAFARGVVLAVKKIKNIDKTGLYSFEDIMNI